MSAFQSVVDDLQIPDDKLFPEEISFAWTRTFKISSRPSAMKSKGPGAALAGVTAAVTAGIASTTAEGTAAAASIAPSIALMLT